MSLFTLRGELSKSQGLLLGLLGFVLFVAFWWILAEAFSIQRPIVEGFNTRLPSSIGADSLKIDRDSLARADSILFANATEFEKVYPLLPTPGSVVTSYPDLINEDQLFYNTTRSIWLNIQGYFWAVLISIPIGFLIGLFPLFRGMFSKQVDALRYLPLTALTGLFIIWFGIEDQMKIAFLAFGIIVYLLPVVVQRIDEVQNVYLKTVFTLGATDWQTIRTVYFPSVMSRLIDDIRILTAISWTYIIIAELVNRQGGVGSLIYIKARQGQVQKVFAILIVIIIIGFLQDRIFVFIDKRLFPHKYAKTVAAGMRESQAGIYVVFGAMILLLLVKAIIPAAASIMTTLVLLVIVTSLLLIAYGEFKVFQSIRAE
ncbi:MAG: ABC transporter permease subunit [Bacteroidota bacterium]